MFHAEDIYPQSKTENYVSAARIKIANAGLRLRLAKAFHADDDNRLADWGSLSDHGRAPYFKRADTALGVLGSTDRPVTGIERSLYARIDAYQEAVEVLTETVGRIATSETAEEARKGLLGAQEALKRAQAS